MRCLLHYGCRFGDDEQGRQYFEAAPKLSPNGIDSNYFCIGYLLDHSKYDEALKSWKKPIARVRPEMSLLDMNLKKKATQALILARERKEVRADFFIRIVSAADLSSDWLRRRVNRHHATRPHFPIRRGAIIIRNANDTTGIKGAA